MKGRDLIDYIIRNDLQDEEYFTNNRIFGMIDEEEAAIKFGVSTSTIRVWLNKDMIKGFNMNGVVFVPIDAKDPRESMERMI